MNLRDLFNNFDRIQEHQRMMFFDALNDLEYLNDNLREFPPHDFVSFISHDFFLTLNKPEYKEQREIVYNFIEEQDLFTLEKIENHIVSYSNINGAKYISQKNKENYSELLTVVQERILYELALRNSIALTDKLEYIPVLSSFDKPLKI